MAFGMLADTGYRRIGKTRHVTSQMAYEATERRTSTPWAWLLALTPIISVVAIQPALVDFHQAAVSPGDRVPQHAVDLITVDFVIDLTATFLLIGASGLLAWLDQRRLRRSGINRPFPSRRGFIYGVDLVGRTVVLRRRVGHGAAPLILAASLFIATMLGLFIEFGIVFVTTLQHGAKRG